MPGSGKPLNGKYIFPPVVPRVSNFVKDAAVDAMAFFSALRLLRLQGLRLLGWYLYPGFSTLCCSLSLRASSTYGSLSSSESFLHAAPRALLTSALFIPGCSFRML